MSRPSTRKIPTPHGDYTYRGKWRYVVLAGLGSKAERIKASHSVGTAWYFYRKAISRPGAVPVAWKSVTLYDTWGARPLFVAEQSDGYASRWLGD